MEGAFPFGNPPIFSPGRIPNTIDFPSEEVPEKQKVLGKQMESIFEYIISHGQEYEILDKNVQIHENKITLGEIDFLLEEKKSGCFFHVEMAYKFYLFDPSLSGLEGWIGPNRRDSLLQKVQKLQNKQFPLLYHPLTENYLHSLGISSSQCEQKVCFKAWLFLPKNHMNYDFSDLNPDCIAGYWISSAEFCEDEYRTRRYLCPPKKDWPLPPEKGENWLSFSEVWKQVQLLLQKKKSPLLWMKTEESTYERIFVVFW